jgi:hypothetical protein
VALNQRSTDRGAALSGPECEPGGADAAWAAWRIDDNGNTFVVREHLTREEADRLVAEFEARGHKQMYWVEREPEA